MRGIVTAALHYLAGLLLAVFIATPVAGAFELPAWQSALERDNALTGRVFDAQGRSAEPDAIIAEMRDADFVILGETHDNRDHHALQAAIVEAIAERGPKPAIVLEMVPRPMQARINAFLGEDNPDAARFGALAEWEKRGWPDWPAYQPILEAAIEYELPVIAGNVSRAQIGEIFSSGTANMDSATVTRYGLDRPLPEQGKEALAEALLKGHCGHMPEGQGERMEMVQRLRDGSMASAMVEASKSGARPVILIAGSGHTRRDFGVPHVLQQLAPDRQTLSLALIEAYKDDNVLQQVAGQYDYMLVTARAEREDPCKRFLERMNSRQKEQDG